MKFDGVRVVDLSLFLPGPTLTQMMADHGADVVKVEPRGEGEPNRHIGQMRNGETVYFANTHRGKRSLPLDLKHPGGKAVFERLVRGADVVIEAFRPGVARRLGVDYAAVATIRPDVVYASLSAFGQDGPLAHRPAHDLAVEAMCGLLSNNVDAHGRPCLPAMPSGDMLTAALGLAGVAMALYRRTQTGRGDYLDLAMMDAILASMPNSMGAAFAEQRAPTPSEERVWGGNAMYRIYETADGRHIVLGGAEVKFARNLLTKLGRPDLIALCEGPPGSRQRPVIDFFEATFRTRSQADWLAFLDELDVCFAPVNDLRRGLDHPQVAHRGMRLIDERGYEHLGTPFKFDDEPGRVRFEAPRYGEHTREILRQLGYGDDEAAALIAGGACDALT